MPRIGQRPGYARHPLLFWRPFKTTRQIIIDNHYEIRRLIMATKEEVTAIIADLGDRIDAFIADHANDTATAVAAALADQKAKLEAEDRDMDAADFEGFAAALMEIVKRVPKKFEPSNQ